MFSNKHLAYISNVYLEYYRLTDPTFLHYAMLCSIIRLLLHNMQFMAQFSLYVHKGGPTPHSFHFVYNVITGFYFYPHIYFITLSTTICY